MNTVIGPIEAGDWYTMVMLRNSIKDMEDRNPNKFKTAIKKEKDLLSYFYKQYLGNEEDDHGLVEEASEGTQAAGI